MNVLTRLYFPARLFHFAQRFAFAWTARRYGHVDIGVIAYAKVYGSSAFVVRY
jgi:hypothetical protein